MSDIPTIVEKVATLKSAIRDLKQTLQQSNLIIGDEQLSEYANVIEHNFSNEVLSSAILYTDTINPDNWHKLIDYQFVGAKLVDIPLKYTFNSVIIPKRLDVTSNKIASLNDGLLSGLTNLKYVAFDPDSEISQLGLRTFENSQNLVEVKLPNCSELTCLRVNLFNGCTKLENIKIPQNIKKIEQGAFQFCSSLTSLYLPDSVLSIGRYCFDHCTNIRYIRVPVSIETVETNAFNGPYIQRIVDIVGSSATSDDDFYTVKNKLIDAGMDEGSAYYEFIRYDN